MLETDDVQKHWYRNLVGYGLARNLAEQFAKDVAAIAAERNEAREWVERMQREARVLTCVYCGHAYEPGTPAHGTQALTDHIKVCEKHPLRQAEAERDRLREALLQIAVVVDHDDGAPDRIEPGDWEYGDLARAVSNTRAFVRRALKENADA